MQVSVEIDAADYPADNPHKRPTQQTIWIKQPDLIKQQAIMEIRPITGINDEAVEGSPFELKMEVVNTGEGDNPTDTRTSDTVNTKSSAEEFSDALSSVIDNVGYEVTKEYIDDAGEAVDISVATGARWIITF